MKYYLKPYDEDYGPIMCKDEIQLFQKALEILFDACPETILQKDTRLTQEQTHWNQVKIPRHCYVIAVPPPEPARDEWEEWLDTVPDWSTITRRELFGWLEKAKKLP